MKTILLAGAAAAAAAFAVPAFAQSGTIRPGHEPGVGLSEPASSNASNIDRADAKSTIAPRLPDPQAGEGATPDQYLRDAERALTQHKTGLAQEALERAQTRMLDRSVEQGQTNAPDQDPRVQTVEQARQALGHGDAKRANTLVGQALAMNGGGGASTAVGGPPSAAAPVSNGGPSETRLAPNLPRNATAPSLGTHSYQPGGAGDAGSSGQTR